MRIGIILLAMAISLSCKVQAQTPVAGTQDMLQQGSFGRYHQLQDSTGLAKKWSVSMYGGMGAGFFNGGNWAVFPLQIGVQLNRRLNNNLYAFAGVAATPVLFNFNRSFSSAELHNNYMARPGFNNNRLAMYSGIQAGLMYVNDARTFSISGSIGISNSNYPFYPAATINNPRTTSFTGLRQ